MSDFEKIPAKLLLFGEYSILRGSPALTLPLWEYQAQLRFPAQIPLETSKESNRQLKLFHHYLLAHTFEFESFLDLAELENDLENGLFLDSNIPYGSGLGSSGSVCAAIYKAYNKNEITDLAQLRLLLGKMESYFHGTSSGLDPLAIAAKAPLLIEGDSCQALSGNQINIPKSIGFCLLNSKIPRNTAPLVERFLASFQQADYAESFSHLYLPALKAIFDSILHHPHLFWKNLRELSRLQARFFRDMIPDQLFPFWEEGLASGKYCMKLLGAGGGGYFIVFFLEKAPIEGLFELKELKITE